MPPTKTYEEQYAALEKQKEEAREAQRQLVADERLRKEEADAKAIKEYWEKRAEKDPDDPQVLRARADLISRERGEASRNGSVVEAAQAVIKNEGNV